MKDHPFLPLPHTLLTPFPLSTASWSKNSRKLLTGSGDCNVVVWDVVSGMKDWQCRFESIIVSACFSTTSNDKLIVCSQFSDAVEVDLKTFERTILPICDPNSSEQPTEQVSEAKTESMDVTIDSTAAPSAQALSTAENRETTPPPTNDPISAPSASSSEPEPKPETIDTVMSRERPYTPVATYSPDGSVIYVGDSRGYVTVIENNDAKTVKTFFKVTSSAGPCGVKGLLASPDLRWLLVNSSDRHLRVFTVNDYKLHRELHDPVNRQQWKTIVFSPDSEHILASCAHRHDHKFYFFGVWSGRMFRTFEGPKEGVLDAVWHPSQPLLVSVSAVGTMYVWGAHAEESWSSFTPGFIELSHNQEYIEREDEFDYVERHDDLPGAPARKKSKLAEDGIPEEQPQEKEDVDIISVDPTEDEMAALVADPTAPADLPDGSVGGLLLALPTTVIPDKYMLPYRA